jgi:hypothetical protein
MVTLAEYYRALGYTSDRWHIGQEHPYLEDFAIRLLRQLSRARVLEIGYQAGGFAVPIILEMQEHPDFLYVGIDNGAYPNAVDPLVITDYLKLQQITCDFSFRHGDAKEVLSRLAPQEFDLILVDHYKPFYFREFYEIASKGWIAPGGYILFHDVLEKAEAAWKECKVVCQAFGFTWQIVRDVPGGLALVKPNEARLRKMSLQRLFSRSQLKAIQIRRSLMGSLRSVLHEVRKRRFLPPKHCG